jgi:DNA-binding response OmpR family regulator
MKKSILFVDDNQMLSRLCCDILRTEGYRAVPAFNAADALKAFETDQFDMLVTDYKMAGMDGLELARAISDKNPALPIIMVTAYGPVKSRCIRECLPKPELFPALLERIRFHLSQANSQEQTKPPADDMMVK